MNREYKPLEPVMEEMERILSYKMIPFWLDRSIDHQFGGYLVSVDEFGQVNPDVPKKIITQCRMLWGFSNLKDYACEADKKRIEEAARQGFHFLITYFWDKEAGGFAWETQRNGTLVDNGKLIYAQSFSIYALSEYYLQYKDEEALNYAEDLFNLLQIYAADTASGGYWENLEEDWSPAPGGIYAGDRKSLDIHMHLMEAFTTLYKASGKEVHKRKLLEVIDIITEKMVDKASGYGLNQFDSRFNKLPAINIYRTWNAERESNESIDEPSDTTSYGHNVELSWLLCRAYDTLGIPQDDFPPLFQKLLDHSLKFGYDYEYGGVYRDGIANEPALITDKEWWQNFESLVGYLNGYLRYGEEHYLTAYLSTWEFVRKHFIIEEFGESRQLLSRNGKPIVSTIGNAWKGIYHTGRALAECVGAAKSAVEIDRQHSNSSQNTSI